MQARAIERRVALCGHASILAATVFATSCDEKPPQEPPDAAVPGGYAVRGSATGVLGPVALELRTDGDPEVLAHV